MRSVLVSACVVLLPAAVGAQVVTVEVTPAQATVRAGEQLRFSVVAKDAAGRVIDGGNVLWLFGPFEIGAVDQGGTVRTFRQGAAKVIARVGGKTGSADLTIRPKGPARVSVTTDAGEVLVGGMTVAHGVAETEDDEPLHDVPVTFRSSDSRIATIDATGAVRALAPGTTRITAQAEGATGQTTVRVLPNPVVLVDVMGARTASTGTVVRFRARPTVRGGGTAGVVHVQWTT
jgi:alpha-amylase